MPQLEHIEAIEKRLWDGSISRFLLLSLTPAEQAIAQIEGWIIGVM